MSQRPGISWGLNHEQIQVGQGPKTSSTADEEICNNEEQNKGSVYKLSTINWLITQTGCNWCIYQVRARYWDVRMQKYLRYADICFLHVLIWLITCIILSVCVSVFLVLSILHTVICVLFIRIRPSGLWTPNNPQSDFFLLLWISQLIGKIDCFAF